MKIKVLNGAKQTTEKKVLLLSSKRHLPMITEMKVGGEKRLKPTNLLSLWASFFFSPSFPPVSTVTLSPFFKERNTVQNKGLTRDQIQPD